MNTFFRTRFLALPLGILLMTSVSQKIWAKENQMLKTCSEHLSRVFYKSKEWKISPEAEKKIEEIFQKQDLLVNQQMAEVFNTLFEERIKNHPERVQSKIRSLVEDAKNYDPKYSKFFQKILRAKSPSPHYNPIWQKIWIRTSDATPDYSQWTLREFMVLLHETVHALQDEGSYRAVRMDAVFSALLELTALGRAPWALPLRYFQEKDAIGSQWELVSRMPQDLRAHLLDEFSRLAHKTKWDNGYSSEVSILEIVEASLRYSNLSKPEFIKKLQPLQGYDAEGLLRSRSNTSLSALRKFYLGLAAIQILYFTYSFYDHEEGSDQVFLPLPIDVFFAIKAFSILFDD